MEADMPQRGYPRVAPPPLPLPGHGQHVVGKVDPEPSAFLGWPGP